MTNQIWIYYGKIECLEKEENSKREKERKAGRKLLLKAVNDWTGKKRSLDELENCIRVGGHGKPYFEPELSLPFFNISHSGEYAVCAISSCKVGIDIQKVQRYHPKLLNRVMTKNERYRIEHSQKKEDLFCRLWCEKESYLKWSGEGITRELSTLERDAWQRSFYKDGYWMCVTAQNPCEIKLRKILY